MSISILDLFKVGLGPSSSHTTGPMLAGQRYVSELLQQDLLTRTGRVEIRLYGSLSATGLGHGTDRAVIGGLLGLTPAQADPDDFAKRVDTVRDTGRLTLNGEHAIPFDWRRDLRFLPVALPFHPNALRLTAFAGNTVLHENTYYSVGGGFVIDARQAERQGDSASQADHPAQPYPFASATELLAQCERSGLDIASVVLENEGVWRTADATRAALADIWQAMQDCVARGLSREGTLPGGLNVPRRAAALHRRLLDGTMAEGMAAGFADMGWANLYALAVNEENAAGGRVVTAPTNGAAGIIPAVMHCYQRRMGGISREEVERFLLTAAAVGMLCKRNASISGAEVGCQGEVGSACSMAAAGLAALLGGNSRQIENAAEIGLEHNLGLTCDPVAGLVQVPCIERNAIATVKAINAAQMALHGNGSHLISLDQAIRTMRDTGRDMLDKYKETSQGGLAISFVEC